MRCSIILAFCRVFTPFARDAWKIWSCPGQVLSAAQLAGQMWFSRYFTHSKFEILHLKYWVIGKKAGEFYFLSKSTCTLYDLLEISDCIVPKINMHVNNPREICSSTSHPFTASCNNDFKTSNSPVCWRLTLNGALDGGREKLWRCTTINMSRVGRKCVQYCWSCYRWMIALESMRMLSLDNYYCVKVFYTLANGLIKLKK